MRYINVKFFLIFFTSQLALADYAWLPRPEHLSIKLGWDYLTSTENFSSDGEKADIRFQNQLVKLTENRFWLEPEYSFIPDWSVSLRTQFINANTENATTPNGALLSSNGFGDVDLGLKWNISNGPPIFTLDTRVKIPPYSTSNPAADELVLGDGNFDWGTKLHVGYKFNRHFAACVSPGVLARFSGYNTQFTLGAMMGVSVSPVYLRLLADWETAFGKPTLVTPLTSNSSVGSGGSFARLSPHGELFSIGAKLGVFLYQGYRLELNASQSLAGKSSANFLKIGANFVADFNLFSEPPKKTRVREVPFEQDQQQGADENGDGQSTAPNSEPD